MERYSFRCRTYIEYNGDIWFLTSQFNGLVCACKKTGKIKKIYNSDRGIVNSRYLYSNIVLYKDKLYLIPNFSRFIGIFDLKTRKMEHIKISEKVLKYKTTCSMGGFIYKEHLYILPAQMCAIIKMDINNYNLEYFTDIFENVEKKEEDFYFRGDYEIVDDIMYAPFVSVAGVIKFDLINEEIKIVADDIISCSSTINRNEDYLYFGGWEEAKIWTWNLKTNKIVEKEVILSKKNDKEFNGGIIKNNYLLLFPYSGNEVVMVDIDDMSYELRAIPKCLEEKITTYCIDKKSGIIKISGDNDLFIVSDLNKEIINKYVTMDEEYNKKIIAKYFYENGYFQHSKEKKNDLQLFLKAIARE